MNPHNWCKALTPPGYPDRIWQCQYCRQEGSFNDMMGQGQKIPCTYVYPKCTHCGQTPTCAPDCTKMLAVLEGRPLPS